ncbi:hypothetical protein LCGC14_2655470 [marine sediment metagenome]|uniref:Uncharacterized protein n=1 Tax=marine sediment metagenome TaxID=412755 RepID=A0A0F8ZTM7_9ZZZZ
MANEIWHTFEEGNTLYALIWRQTDDKVWNNTDSQFDVYTDADIDKYDIVLTNQVDSDYYSVDFPSAVGAGIYRVQVMKQAGGSIDADDDMGVAQGELYWDGSAEIDLFTLDASINDDIIGEDGNTLESLSDQMDVLSAQGSRVLNRYPTRSNPDV